MAKLSTWLLLLALVVGAVLIAYALLTTPVGTDYTYNMGTTATPGQYELAFSGNAAGGFVPYVYTWTFGDGSGAAGPSVRHTYLLPGTYTVNLTVKDSVGHAASVSKTIQVPSTPPPTQAAVFPAPPHVASPTISLTAAGIILVIGAGLFYVFARRPELIKNYFFIAVVVVIVFVIAAAYYLITYQ